MSKALSLKKTRVDFISDLLQSRKLGAGDRERVFGLVAKEIDLMESKGDFILSEIEAIKAQLNAAIPEEAGAARENVVEPENEKVEQKYPLPEYITPEGNAGFLTELNVDPILKSITHNVDSDFLQTINDALGIEVYDFRLHLAEIKKRYKKLSSRYYLKTTKGLTEKTYAYIFGNKPWSEDKIKMSWSNESLSSWAEANPGYCPNAAKDLSGSVFTFDRIKPENHKHIRSLPDLVLFYKKQVAIRFDNNLQTLVKGWNIDFLEKVQFDIEQIRTTIDLYTDVEKLNQAYRRIIELCIECHPNTVPDIQLDFQQQEIEGKKYFVFSIWQRNAIFNKPVDQLIARYGHTFSNLIIHQLNGLCNWTLEADFGLEEYAKLSLWPRTGTYEKIDKMEGVKYSLIFNY